MKNNIVACALLLVLFSCAMGGKKTSREGLPEKFYTTLDEAILESKRENKRLVAAFDWDNTMIKNDIGDAVFFWMLSRNLFKVPGSWSMTSPFLASSALKELNLNCPLQKMKKNASLKTSEGACGKTMLAIYSEGKLQNGTEAWNTEHKNYVKEFIEPAYAWAVSLLQGHTVEEVHKITQKVVDHSLSQSVGAKQKLFGQDYADYIRINEPMKNLVSHLQNKGVEVWVVSASQQNIVETFAKNVGISADRVIGVRNVVKDGVLASQYLPCGPVYGNNQEIITYKQGKRCWINKEIFKSSLDENLSPSPTLFAAGDSDTDVEFLMDAEVKLVINRNKPEIMCQALANRGGKWFIIPLFYEPKAVKTEAYNCKKWALPDQNE